AAVRQRRTQRHRQGTDGREGGAAVVVHGLVDEGSDAAAHLAEEQADRGLELRVAAAQARGDEEGLRRPRPARAEGQRVVAEGVGEVAGRPRRRLQRPEAVGEDGGGEGGRVGRPVEGWHGGQVASLPTDTASSCSFDCSSLMGFWYLPPRKCLSAIGASCMSPTWLPSGSRMTAIVPTSSPTSMPSRRPSSW